MSKRIIIVGGVAGGASTAARLRRLNEHDEIIMFEQGPHISFSNCALPYYLSDIVPSAENLLMMGVDQFYNEYRIQARVNSRVIGINRAEKKITVKNLETNEEYTEVYDKLVLSPGARPIIPNVPGAESNNIFTVKNVVDIENLKNFIKDKKNIAVVGGGFIGLEVAENLKLAKEGFNVTLVEAEDQVMAWSLDYDLVQILHKEMHDNGINLILSDGLKEIESDKIVLTSGREVKADAIVMACGVTPETTLAEQSGLSIGETGGILVDHNYQTNDKDIYAIGDAIQVYNKLSQRPFLLAMAGPAQRQARAVANHINGCAVIQKGYIGSSVIQMFEYNAAATGLTERMIKKNNLSVKYDYSMVIPFDKVGLMPNAAPVFLKIIFEVPTGRILGAQAVGKGEVDKRINLIAAVMNFDGTLEDLQDLELAYAPPYSTVKDATIYGALSGLNILRKEYKQVPVTKVRELYQEGAYFLDVRNIHEYELGHIKGSVNIPLNQLRDRLDELPKDKTIYVLCRSAQRSYNAARALGQLGFTDVYNITGSFLGISMFEYFNDVTKDRDPIVTDYNFN